MSDKNRYQLRNSRYRVRFMLSLVLAQIFTIGVFTFWPVNEDEETVYREEEVQEVALIDEVEVTIQESAPPAPPKPQIPEPVPDDEIVEEEIEFDAELNLIDMPISEPSQGTGSFGDEDVIVSSPQVPPTVVKIVEATPPANVPSEYKGKLEMIVNFLVDKNGDVEEVSIVEIRKYGSDGSAGDYETLPYLQHGLMDAVLEAALRWKFRPAKQNGEPVKAFTKQRFNY